jgi:hypothetical protein
MPARRTRKASTLAVKSMELALAAPPVVAHRLTRMALAGPVLSDRDRREFQSMITEKTVAFAQAWWDMSVQAVRANQMLAVAMLGWFTPFWMPRPSAAAAAAQMQEAALGVLAKGLIPVHRKAMSNARRLARTPLT